VRPVRASTAEDVEADFAGRRLAVPELHAVETNPFA